MMFNFSNFSKYLTPTGSTGKKSLSKFLPDPYNPPMQDEEEDPAPPDFASSYAKINSNRPNRLAYQQSVNAGPEEIKRGKLAKLGAMLAGVGTSMSGGAQAGYNLGMSAYNQPQERADSDFAQKNKGLASLAGMENDDISNQLKVLEMQNEDYYRRKGDKRADKSLSLQEQNQAADNKRQDKQLELSSWLPLQEDDGNTYLVNKATNEKKLIGKTGMTTQEQIDFAKNKAQAEETVKEPGRIAADTRDTNRAVRVANIGAQSRSDIADANNASRELIAGQKAELVKAKMDKVGASLKPGDQAKQVWNDLTSAFNSDPNLKGLDPEDYVSVNGGVVSPTSESMWGDSPAKKAIKQKINKIISDSLKKSAASGVNGGKTTSGGSYTITPVN